jgi:hypothetical protein
VGRSERDKGRRGEREVAMIYEAVALEVRGLEGSGDHLIVCGEGSGFVLHSECKRQEQARPWLWWEQASNEAPPETIPVVHFRRNRSPWLAMLAATDLALILQWAVYGARRRVQELDGGEVAPVPLLRDDDLRERSVPEAPRPRAARPTRPDGPPAAE